MISSALKHNIIQFFYSAILSVNIGFRQYSEMYRDASGRFYVSGCVGKVLTVGVSGCVEKVLCIGRCRESSKSVTDGPLRESSSGYIYTPFGNHCNHRSIRESCNLIAAALIIII